MKKIVFLFFCFLTFSKLLMAQQPAPQGPPQPPAKLPPFTKKGAPLPPFRLEKMDGKWLTNANLKVGKPVMVMIFSPECDHCEHMIDSMKAIADQFKTTQLLLVAEDRNRKYMDGFIKKTNIGSIPLFQNIGTNKGELIFSIYTYKILPQVNFYNTKHQLVKTFDGNYPFDSLKLFIK